MIRTPTRKRLCGIVWAAGIVGLGILSGCASMGALPAGGCAPQVRVALVTRAARVTVGIRSVYRIVDPASGATLAEGRRLLPVTAVAEGRGIRLGDAFYPVPRIRLASDKDVSLYVKGRERRYRGVVDLVSEGPGRLTVVNILGMEEYVRGVLYHEVSQRWPMEALKAQAVASRSYALYQVQTSAGRPYDVTSNIYSQVYGGRSAERYRTNLAVARTRGEILTFHGKVLPAFFHACCGGHTENAAELWNIHLYPLHGVKSNFCIDSPHYHWKVNLRLKNIQDKLNAHGYHLWLIKDIRVDGHDASGRNRMLVITTRDGHTATIRGKDFRQIVGPNVIPSNLYRIVMKGYYVDFIGRGWGHGVGMCQWGARGMARQHYTYREILQHFYPGSVLANDCQVVY